MQGGSVKAAQYAGEGRIEVGDVQPEAPGPGEVEIAVAYTGICGTDLHIFHGTMDKRVTVPQSIGHEMAGVIARLGEGVEGLTVGQPVTVMPLLWCGECPACVAGNQHICQRLDFVGIDSVGSMQERWTVPASIIVPLPEGLSLSHGALVEPVAVACHDVARSRLVEGETAVVIGGGPIGQLIASVARATGARVILVEPNQTRREAAAHRGIGTIDPTTEDAVAWVEQATDGAGADVVFEVAGAAVTALGCVDYAKVRGRVVIVAIHNQPVPMNLFRMFWRELEIIGARVYERADYDRAIALLAAGAIPADELITRIVPLERAREAFVELERGTGMKVLVDSRRNR
nr:alcohol dehydrogenase catalytic domain-containing protein [Agrococcus sp. ARC_14]